ncbi:MAG TPA: GntR family transcriptional regulator [Streptosporangiaceae bacterium]
MGAHLDESDRVTVLDRSKTTRTMVEKRIRALISSDQLDSEGRLPTERELADMFRVSRTTVRQVLDGLEYAGLVRRRRGRTGGTFATLSRVDIDFGYLAGIPSYLRAQGFRPGAHVVSARMVPADAVTADALQIPSDALVHDVIRVRLADEVRISLEHARFPVALFPDLLDERLDDSIYELMAQRYDLKVIKAVERLVAVLADQDQATLLGIEVGDPLMAIERIAYDGSDQPLEYSTDLFRGDRTRVIAWAYGAAAATPGSSQASQASTRDRSGS